MAFDPLGITTASQDTCSENVLATYDDLLSVCRKLAVRDYPEETPHAVTFSDTVIHLEYTTRLLWALVPCLAGGNDVPEWPGVLDTIVRGVDPGDPGYWGTPTDFDQRLVEMAALGFALCVIPDHFWYPLDRTQRADLTRWLSYINSRRIPECNWVMFRAVVNCGLWNVGSSKYDSVALTDSLDLLERMYLGEGWYNDGLPQERRARDYYVAWALHFYSLVITWCTPELIGDRVPIYRERADAYARQFRHWFSPEGSAIPYGRSLSYRFAQAAFWGALAVTGSRSLASGEIRGLYMNNLRYWLKQDIRDSRGQLTIGYTYRNPSVAERYISSSSPLFALKAFLPLALPRDHQFWSSEEERPERRDTIVVQEKPGFLICGSRDAGHHYVLSAGQWTPGASNEHGHLAEKYAKFAYSSHFGFNIATDLAGIDKLAPDNMLLFSEGDGYYRFRTETFEHKIEKTFLRTRWYPMPGVDVLTWLIPIPSGPWHLRFHEVNCTRRTNTLEAVEGGFPLPHDDPDVSVQIDGAFATGPCGISGLQDLVGNRTGSVITAAPNSNVVHRRVVIPILRTSIETGIHHLVSLVMAHPDPGVGGELWKHPPNISSILMVLPLELHNHFKGAACEEQRTDGNGNR